MLSHEQIKEDVKTIWDSEPASAADMLGAIADQAKAYTTLKARVDKVLGMEKHSNNVTTDAFDGYENNGFNSCLTTIKQTLKGDGKPPGPADPPPQPVEEVA